jgi:hypothetical protein
MRAQVTRIGEAWEYLEKKILINAQYNNVLFKERGLKKEWLEWMKRKHKIELDRLSNVLDEKLKVFEDNPGVNTNPKRWDYDSIFGRAEPKKMRWCGFEKSSTKMQERVELLKDAKKKLKDAESELKL